MIADLPPVLEFIALALLAAVVGTIVAGLCAIFVIPEDE